MAGVFLTGFLDGAGEARVVAGMGGAYSKLKKLEVVRDLIEAHHMPQEALHFTSKAEGGALTMMMEEHKMTRTWGARGIETAAADAGLPFRTVLYKDIRDVRGIVGSKYNAGIKELLEYYRQNFPHLMAK